MQNLNTTKNITIIGGGFSGASILAHQVNEVVKIIRQENSYSQSRRYHITLVDPSTEIGPGHPYNPALDTYLLNQPAYAMSVFSDNPDHFVQWIDQNIPTENKDDIALSFQPRKTYGAYLHSVFNDASDIINDPDFPVELSVVHSHALASVSSDGLFTVTPQAGAPWQAQNLIIADGHHKNELLSNLRDRPNYFDGIIDCDQFSTLPKTQQRVLIVGSGQDMMDRLSDLHHCGYDGIIDVVSRNGVLPWVFDPALYAPDRKIEPYRFAHFTPDKIYSCDNFGAINTLWNKELIHADNTGYGPAHILGAYFSSSELQDISSNHKCPIEWQKQADYIDAFYGNPTPKQRHNLLAQLIRTNKLHQFFSSVSEDRIQTNTDQTFTVAYDDGTCRDYDAIINSAACARSLRTRKGSVKSPLVAHFDKAGLIKWASRDHGIISAGKQNNSNLFYAGPYSYPGKWGVETFRNGLQNIAKQSLNNV